ncbi:hypothetical protein IMZ48_12715 [Candidatus Bathyarchaeota archaeon]|nr:hypothetical protein [Candidatus Bathyarchaeota archaeon]
METYLELEEVHITRQLLLQQDRDRLGLMHRLCRDIEQQPPDLGMESWEGEPGH